MKTINLLCRTKTIVSFLALTALFTTACSEINDDNIAPDDQEQGDGSDTDIQSQYVIAVSPASDAADILLYSDSMESGDLTVLGSGVETGLISAQWYFYNDQRVFGFKYSDGDPTPMQTFISDGTKPVAGNTYESYRFTTYGTWGDYVVTSSSNSYTSQSTGVYEPYYGTEVYPRYMQIARYKSESGSVETYDFESDDYLGTGEYTNFAGFAESDGKLYVSVYPMGITGYGATKYTESLEDESGDYYGDKASYLNYISSGWGGTNSGSFKPSEAASTLFPDQFHIAIFANESDFPHNPTLIKDDRMSPACGRQQSAQYPTIAADQDENIYIFSPGNERSYTTGKQLYSDVAKTDEYAISFSGSDDGLFYQSKGTHKASVMRIQKGETVLDESYGVFDVESVMGDRSFLCCYFIEGSDSKFLVKAMNESNVQYSSANNKYYVVDVVNKSAIEVTGMPEPTTITSASRNPLFEDGKAYVGITSSENNNPAIYMIDSETGVATKTAEIECYNILSIGKLSK